MTEAKQLHPQKLTADQRALLAPVRKEWLAAGVATGPADRGQALDGVAKAYRAAALPLPGRVLWFDSPLAAAPAAGQLWRADLSEEVDAAGDRYYHRVMRPLLDQAWSSTRWAIEEELLSWLHFRVDSIGELIRNEIHHHTPSDLVLPGDLMLGQHAVKHLAAVDLFVRWGVGEGEPPTGPMRVARNAGCWWPGRDTVLLTERPTELHLDKSGHPHNPRGPAVLYPDGFAVYAWHGVRAPRRVITGAPTGRDWSKESDAKVRGVIAERMGYRWLLTNARKLNDVSVRKLHSSPEGKLWCINEPGSGDYGIGWSFVAAQDIWLLELPDRSVRRVPPDTPTAEAAAAWIRRSSKDYSPPTPT